MNRQELIENIKHKRSFLCVGLDTDIRKIPEHLLQEENPMLAFNKAIIDATADYCVAYKPNFAFYEAMGAFGIAVLADTIAYIKEHYPDQLIIADAKRGDIGNTALLYARSCYDYFKADAVTVAPYMGRDAVAPFLEWHDKWLILLGLTSNEGAKDFQLQKMEDGRFFFEHIIEKTLEWSNEENTMYVVGATRSEYLQKIREIIPNHFLLVPGIGAQGGSLEDLVTYAMNEDCGLLVNSSRAIIYCDSSEHFESKVRQEAENLRRQMEAALIAKNII